MRSTDELNTSNEHETWIREILLAKGVTSQCEDHAMPFIIGEQPVLAKAIREVRRRRPRGLSADAAESMLREQVAGLKNKCPACI